jgi:hypothetical protein
MRSKLRAGRARSSSSGGTAGPALKGKARKMAVYTPPATQAARTRYRLRPAWHKVIAVMLVASGGGLFFSCEFNIGGIHHYGGHVWFLVGIAVAAASTWWFGLFDPA